MWLFINFCDAVKTRKLYRKLMCPYNWVENILKKNKHFLVHNFCQTNKFTTVRKIKFPINSSKFGKRCGNQNLLKANFNLQSSKISPIYADDNVECENIYFVHRAGLYKLIKLFKISLYHWQWGNLM